MDERIVGIDYGRKRIGLAIGTTEFTIARPLRTITVATEADAIKQVSQVIHDEQANRAVLGLPLNMNGSESAMATEVRRFAQHLTEAAKVPVELVEERWSSKEAERSLRGSGLRGTERKERVDTIAAVFLLQTYLERRSRADRDAAGDAAFGSRG